MEELKVVTETNITTTKTINIEEKYKVMAPEAMQETFMSDSEDEGGKLFEFFIVSMYRYLLLSQWYKNQKLLKLSLKLS